MKKLIGPHFGRDVVSSLDFLEKKEANMTRCCDFDVGGCTASFYLSCVAYKEGKNCWEVEVSIPCCKRNNKERCRDCNTYQKAVKLGVITEKDGPNINRGVEDMRYVCSSVRDHGLFFTTKCPVCGARAVRIESVKEVEEDKDLRIMGGGGSYYKIEHGSVPQKGEPT